MASPTRRELDQAQIQKKKQTSETKKIFELASAAAVATVITAGLGIYEVFFKAATPTYAVPIAPYEQNLLRGDKVVLALSIDNKTTGEAMDVRPFACSLEGAPHGVSVEHSKDVHCSFVVQNVTIADEVSNWPLPVDFRMVVRDKDHTSPMPPTARVYFHDIDRPTIDTSSFVVSGGRLKVTPIIRTNREDAKIVSCEWRPASQFDAALIRDSSCSGELKTSALVGPLPTISVVVTFQVGDQPTFEARSDEAVVPMHELTPTGPNPLVAQIALLGNQTAKPDAEASPQMSSPKDVRELQSPAKAPISRATVNSPAITVAALITSLSGLNGADRYDGLSRGLRQLTTKELIDANDALDLLGPLVGALRRSALTGLILPRLKTPITSDQVSNLIDGFPSADRADVLHSLRRCIASPVDTESLLAKIIGADRQWVERTLTFSGPRRVSRAD